MARPLHLNGGKVQVYPASARDLVEDMKALDYRIEALEAQIERLTAQRNKLQTERYREQDQLYNQTTAHLEAVSGQATPLCRVYQAATAAVAAGGSW